MRAGCHAQPQLVLYSNILSLALLFTPLFAELSAPQPPPSLLTLPANCHLRPPTCNPSLLNISPNLRPDNGSLCHCLRAHLGVVPLESAGSTELLLRDGKPVYLDSCICRLLHLREVRIDEKRNGSKSTTPPSHIANNLPLVASLLPAPSSDTMLSIDKFTKPIPEPARTILVMSTYWAGQLLISFAVDVELPKASVLSVFFPPDFMSNRFTSFTGKALIVTLPNHPPPLPPPPLLVQTLPPQHLSWTPYLILRRKSLN